MKKRIVLAIFAVALLSFTLSAASVDGADNEPAQFHINGYILEAGRNIPKSDVTVTLKDSLGNIRSVTTDQSGFFSLPAQTNLNLQIMFEAHGYSLISCPYTAALPGTDFLSLDLSKASYNSITRTYTITSDIAGLQCAIMSATAGKITGTVSYNNGTVDGATITLRALTDGPAYTATTDSKGFFEISCPIGSYTLVVNRTGFEASVPLAVEISRNDNIQSITLEKSDVNRYMGLDLAHLLMLIAVCVGISLAALAWMLSNRMNRSDRPGIIDDSIDEEEDTIRHP